MKGSRRMYQFKCEVAEIHGEYHVHSLLLWNGLDQEEWVAGDAFRISAGALGGISEHEDIMTLIQRGLSRISQKHDRTLF